MRYFDHYLQSCRIWRQVKGSGQCEWKLSNWICELFSDLIMWIDCAAIVDETRWTSHLHGTFGTSLSQGGWVFWGKLWSIAMADWNECIQFAKKHKGFHEEIWITLHLTIVRITGCSWGTQDQRRLQSSNVDAGSQFYGHGEAIAGWLCRDLPKFGCFYVSVLCYKVECWLLHSSDVEEYCITIWSGCYGWWSSVCNHIVVLQKSLATKSRE